MEKEGDVSKSIMKVEGTQNDKTKSPTKEDQVAASSTPPPVAATQPNKPIRYVSGQHAIVVETGEDIAEKIITFAKGGPKAISIRSARSKVTKVVLKRTSTSSEIETHEGFYNIVFLYGSFTSYEVEGQRRLIGGLHISFASERRSFVGRVVGALIAASEVKVTVMSLTEEAKEDS